MKRNRFIKQLTALTIIGLPLLAISNSCSTNDNPTPTPPPPGAKDCLANGTNSSISANHGHVLNVSKTDVQNGAEKSYSIDGSASHDHTVVITASNFDLLKTNQSIQVDSSMGGGHSHAVTVSCA